MGSMSMIQRMSSTRTWRWTWPGRVEASVERCFEPWDLIRYVSEPEGEDLRFQPRIVCLLLVLQVMLK
jgi:hypothetical protein